MTGTMLLMNPFQIVGILNITPDSFYDGGKLVDLDHAMQQAAEMIEEGADVLDVGGESTFIDRDEVSVDQELERVIPVIEAIKSQWPDQLISIDTYKAPVAEAAVAMGASMINDVTAGRGDPDMFSTVAELGCDIVLMHAKDETSRTTMDAKQYDDVCEEVYTFFVQRKQLAEEEGINSDHIILDPGLGFFISSEAKYSYEILANLDYFSDLGCRLYVSPSRKSFLAGEERLPPEDRLPGTIAASALAVQNGATFIRTHDVAEVRRGCEAAVAMLKHQGR